MTFTVQNPEHGVLLHWSDGTLTGTPEVMTEILRTVADGDEVQFNYWAGPPTLRFDFGAWLTIMAVISRMFGDDEAGLTDVTPEIPLPPEGYVEEGGHNLVDRSG